VTGGLGFIGSNLARRLVELGASVTLVDCLTPDQGGLRHNILGLEERITVEVGDLRDAAVLARALPGQEVVFNLAGQTSHMDSMTDPITDLELNCRAQLALLEGLRRLAPDARVVFASTRQIYGAPDYFPVDEAHPLRPVDVNGIHKLAGESYHLLYARVYGLRAMALRLTNTYGPRMRVKDARQTFLGLWIRAALESWPFEVWGGSQLRDYTYVDDTVDALLRAACTPELWGGAYNLSGQPEPLSLLQTAELLTGLTGGRFEVKEFPPERRRIDIGDFYADDTAFRRLTGWTPGMPLKDGLERTLGYFREHLAHYVP
jgi:nucleoside-diphosphate-sugar epimerase